jgi:cation diffusion facilitator CzcD-associated flavoprotein CzcO
MGLMAGMRRLVDRRATARVMLMADTAQEPAMDTAAPPTLDQAKHDDKIRLAVVMGWLGRFEAALTARDAKAAETLFAADGCWRDIVAFTWTIEHHVGRSAISAAVMTAVARTSPRHFRVAPQRAPPRLVNRNGAEILEALFSFETAHGQGSGVVRLVADPATPGAWVAWIVSTVLDDLSKAPGASTSLRPGSAADGRAFGGDNWLDRRRKSQAYADHEPACVVIGAGQAGLAIAARLGALGVDTLVIDKHARVGDNWRKRYHALTLHNEVFVNHFPHMPFPETFPVYIPKDKLANWFEHYAESMDLNVWTDTALTAGYYDEAASTWSLTLQRGDGTTRTVRPRDVVFATGVSAIPTIPKLPGLDDFAGPVIHSGAFTSGDGWAGRNVLIVGTGTSAHDVAQELAACRANVTMIQRNSTYVVSLAEAQRVYAIYQEGPSVDDCDLLSTATSYPLMVGAYRLSTATMKQVDQPLLDRLSASGMRLNDGGPDATGFQMQYLRRGGGYYFNVGCSELIAEGRIGVIQWDTIERFCKGGALLKSGRVVPADLLIMATGYKNQQETVRAYLGDAVADRIGPVWGFDDGGELANMWKRTPQRGLWFTAGSLAQSRIYSKYLALQIKAAELGLIQRGAPALPANGVLAVEAAAHRKA